MATNQRAGKTNSLISETTGTQAGIWFGGMVAKRFRPNKSLFAVSKGKSPRIGKRDNHATTFIGIDFLYLHIANDHTENAKKIKPIGKPNIKKAIIEAQETMASIRKIIDSISCILFILLGVKNFSFLLLQSMVSFFAKASDGHSAFRSSSYGGQISPPRKWTRSILLLGFSLLCTP